MTREEQLDWLCRLRGEVKIYMPIEWVNQFEDALTEYIKALSQEPCDDAISREFVELVVEYPPADLCTYPEYKGKPYYSIKYYENGEEFIGYGTYKPEVLSQYLKEYFMPTVTQKSGKWIKIPKYGKWKCSKCGTKFRFTFKEHDYCPNCGAKMGRSDKE